MFHSQEVQHRMVIVVNFFENFEINCFGFVVAICDLVYDMDTIFPPPLTALQHLEIFSEI